MKCCGNLDINHKVLHRLLKLDFECIGACYTTLHATYLSSFPCRNEKKVSDSPTLTNYTAAAERVYFVSFSFLHSFFCLRVAKMSLLLSFFTSTASLPTNPVCLGRFFSLSPFLFHSVCPLLALTW